MHFRWYHNDPHPSNASHLTLQIYIEDKNKKKLCSNKHIRFIECKSQETLYRARGLYDEDDADEEEDEDDEQSLQGRAVQ